jgi:ABC-2 type transport system ATP-binding protein
MIQVENLYKSFSGRTVVHGISFDVAQGEVLGFLGPNGAGKSTTMRMLTGFLEPDSGKVSICGHDMARSPATKTCKSRPSLASRLTFVA